MINKKSIKPNNMVLNTKLETQLSENLILVSEEIPNAESYALGFFFEIGSRDEKSEFNGIAHFIEHCAFRRTSKFNSKQIASKFESFGAYANAFTTQESTCYYVRALKNNFVPVFRLLSDITLDTKFDESDAEKEKQIILEEIKSYDDDPEESIFDVGDKIIFGDHPMGASILGTEDTLNKITIDDLERFHKNYYLNGKLVISYVGPHNHQYILDNISKYLIKNQNNSYTQVERLKPEVLAITEIEVEKSVSQSHLLIGSRIPGYDEDTRYILPLFNILFGDGMSSRLYQNLRDKFGIAYSIYSTLQIHSDSGILYIYAASDTKKLKKTQKLIIDEIQKLLDKGVSSKELHRSKEQLKSSIIMEQESLSARMQSLAKNVLMFTDFEDIKKTMTEINSISSKDIHDLIELYISPNKLSIVKMIGTI